MKKRLFVFLAALSLAVTTALAAPVKPESGYVADEAGVLTQETIDHINEKNQILFENTGAVIAVVTVTDTGGEAIDRYTYTLFNDWGVGERETSNGLLLLLDIGGDNYFAAPGKNIKKDLTENKISDLLYDYLEADFAAKDYDAGVEKVFDAFYDWYEGYYTQPGGGQEPAGNGGSAVAAWGVVWLFQVIVGLIILVVVLDGMRWSRYRRRYLMPGMPPPRVIYTPFLWGRSYYRPRRPHGGSRPPRPPRPPAGGGFSGSGFGGGVSRGGGAGRTSRPSSGFRSSGSSRGSRGGFGGGRSRGGGAGRRR